MGKVRCSGGAGGVSSTDVTGTLNHCLEGSTYLASDSNDDPAVGTLPKSAVLSTYGGTLQYADW